MTELETKWPIYRNGENEFDPSEMTLKSAAT